MTDSGPAGPPGDSASAGAAAPPPYEPPFGPATGSDGPTTGSSGPAGPGSGSSGPPSGAPVDVPPAPPAGPGAVPLFAAPPTEGRTVRMWLGLGVAALALLLCCGGGTAATIGLVVSGNEAINEQARVAVGDYFGAVVAEDYGKAYRLLCDAAKRRESPAEFTRRLDAEPKVDSYRIGEATVTDHVVVPVEVTYSGGGGATRRVGLAQDNQSGEFKVCSVS